MNSAKNKSDEESDVPWKEIFWIVGSRLRPYSDFSKHLQKSRNVQCEPNPGNSPHKELRPTKEIDK